MWEAYLINHTGNCLEFSVQASSDKAGPLNLLLTFLVPAPDFKDNISQFSSPELNSSLSDSSHGKTPLVETTGNKKAIFERTESC